MDEAEKSFNKFLLLWPGDFVPAIGSGSTSFGRGVGFVIVAAGPLLCATAGMLFCMKSIRTLEGERV